MTNVISTRPQTAHCDADLPDLEYKMTYQTGKIANKVADLRRTNYSKNLNLIDKKTSAVENSYFDKRVIITISTWCFCIIFAAPLMSISWPLSYSLYLIIATSSLTCGFLYKKSILGRFPSLLALQIVAILVLMAAHSDDMPTVINLGSIAFGSAILGIMQFFLPHDRLTLRRMLSAVRWTLFAMVILGVILGPVLAGPFHLRNPITDLLSGQRVRIFSGDTGHSPLLDAGVIFLIIALSHIFRENFVIRMIWATFGIACIYLARSAIGYIGLIGCLYTYAIETIPLKYRMKNAIHVFFISTSLILAPSYIENIIEYVRNIQTGGHVSQVYYRGDLTAGRAELNSQLIRTAQQHPYAGGGVSTPIIQFGITNHDGTVLAHSESGLRMAAKYGWIYFLIIICICLSPITTLLTQDKSVRIIGISFTIYLCDVLSLNSIFELSHTWNTLAFLPLAMFLCRYGLINRGSHTSIIQLRNT